MYGQNLINNNNNNNNNNQEELILVRYITVPNQFEMDCILEIL